MSDQQKKLSLKRVNFKELTPYNYQRFMNQMYKESIYYGESGAIFQEKINEARVLRKEYKKAKEKLKLVKSPATIKKYESKLKMISGILQNELSRLTKGSTSQRLNFKRKLSGGIFSYEFSKSTMEFVNADYIEKINYIVDSLGFEILSGDGSEQKLRRLEQLIGQLWEGDFNRYEEDKQKFFDYIKFKPEYHPLFEDKSKLRK